MARHRRQPCRQWVYDNQHWGLLQLLGNGGATVRDGLQVDLFRYSHGPLQSIVLNGGG